MANSPSRSAALGAMLPSVRIDVHDTAGPTDPRFRYGEPGFTPWTIPIVEKSASRGRGQGCAAVALVALACVALVVGYEVSLEGSQVPAPTAANPALQPDAVDMSLSPALGAFAVSLQPASAPPPSPPSSPPAPPPKHLSFRERHAAWIAAGRAALDAVAGASMQQTNLAAPAADVDSTMDTATEASTDAATEAANGVVSDVVELTAEPGVS